MNDNNGAIIMVDFENVGLGGLEGYELLNSNDTLYLFVSDKAKTIKKYIANGITRTGVNIVYRRLVNEGKNGLDFYIASEIGYLRGVGEKRNISIISKDKGYSAIVDYWKLRTKSRVFVSNTIEAGLRAAIHNSTSRYEELLDLTSTVDIPYAFDFRGNTGADINIDTIEKTKDIEIDEEDSSNAISNEIESATVVNIEVESLNTKEEKIDAFVESCESVKYSSPEVLKEILTKANGMCNLHNLLVKATTNSRGQKIYNELKDKKVEILFK